MTAYVAVEFALPGSISDVSFTVTTFYNEPFPFIVGSLASIAALDFFEQYYEFDMR